MSKIIQIFLAIWLCGASLYAQVTRSKSTQKKAMQAKIANDLKNNSDCVFYNKFTPQQRIAKYPFSKAVNVLAVSFKSFSGPKNNGIDTSIVAPTRGLHVVNGLLDTTTLIEKKLLDTKQIEEFTSLLFNINYRKVDATHIEETMGCFDPRNAFIFLDADGRVFDYLMICFSCLGSQSYSDKFDIGVVCNQKYQMFSDYFKKVGVSYGTFGRDYHSEDREEWKKGIKSGSP